MMDSIVVLSFPKSGTVLIRNIIREITQKKLLIEELNSTIDFQVYLKEAGNLIGQNLIPTGLYQVEDLALFVRANFHNEKGVIIDGMNIDVTDIVQHQIIDTGCIYNSHVFPSAICRNKLLKKIKKKVYIYRDGLDVVNSYMKFLHNTNRTYNMMRHLNSQYKFQKVNYTMINNIDLILKNWVIHTGEYLKNQQEFFGIQYEKLLLDPIGEIEKLCKYLDVTISKNAIERIIEKLFYKELHNFPSQNKYFAHYNNSPKMNEWMNFLPKEFYDGYKKTYKQHLKELGYTSKLYIDNKETEEFRGCMRHKIAQYNKKSSIKYQDVEADSFIKNLKNYLLSKRVVIYGYGVYSAFLQDALFGVEIKYIYDDKKQLLGARDPKFLLEDSIYYDVIIVAVHYKYYEKILKKIETILPKEINVEIINGYNFAFDKHSLENIVEYQDNVKVNHQNISCLDFSS
ncbi:MAG: hypothetical protein EOM50_14245 [Erysipelotrichia bacterium]|nr:hypothetical protein [Erysipelotrichia bacterium]